MLQILVRNQTFENIFKMIPTATVANATPVLQSIVVVETQNHACKKRIFLTTYLPEVLKQLMKQHYLM